MSSKSDRYWEMERGVITDLQCFALKKNVHAQSGVFIVCVKNMNT